MADHDAIGDDTEVEPHFADTKPAIPMTHFPGFGRFGRSAALGLVIFCGSTVEVVAQDVITFLNGDRLSGRIKRLERGELVLELPIAGGDVHVDWARVSIVESQRVFQFQTRNGDRFLGRIRRETDPEAGTLVVEYGGVTQTYQRDDIVLVAETVGQFRGLLEIRASGGLSLAKSNDQKQMNAEASVSYETPAFTLSASASSLFATQREGGNTNRQFVSLQFHRNVGDRWGWSALNTYLVNEEQQLNLRTVAGGGPVRVLVRNNQVELSVLGGVVWNNEQFDPATGQDVTNNVEALGGLFLSFYQFKQWELNTTFLTFSSMTTGGRFRTNLEATLRLRLVRGKPFWWNISQILDTDNRPPADTSGTDYVTTTSLSWTFP